MPAPSSWMSDSKEVGDERPKFSSSPDSSDLWEDCMESDEVSNNVDSSNSRERRCWLGEFFRLADRCHICGKRPGFVWGIRGFGLRERGHAARCQRRLDLMRWEAQAAGQCTRALHQERAAPNVQHRSATRPFATGESLAWLNELVASLWPKIDKTAQKIVQETVVPSVRESLPKMLQSKFAITKFTLGDAPLEMGPIEFYHTPQGIKLEIGMNLDSTADIEISLGAKVGIKSLTFSGKLVIRMGPLIEEAPIVGGVLVFFTDQPKLDLDFTGLGNIADFPGLAGVVRGAIDSTLNGICVLPNAIAVPMASDKQGVDPALVAQPNPVGVLRVAVIRATDLVASDLGIVSESTSDPYVSLRVADQKWRSSTVAKNCKNPKWLATDTTDFLVADRAQKLFIEVFDEDWASNDDFLGMAKPLSVREARHYSGVHIPLFGRDVVENGKQGPEQGRVWFNFQWLELVPGRITPEGAVVTIVLRRIMLPSKLGNEAVIRMRIGDVERRTAVLKPAKHEDPLVAVDEAMRGVLLRCKQNDIDRDVAAKITGLQSDALDEFFGEKTASQIEASTELILNATRAFHVPLATADVKAQILEISATDHQGKEVLGSASIPLKDVTRCPNLTFPNQDQFAQATLQLKSVSGDVITAEVKVILQGLVKV